MAQTSLPLVRGHHHHLGTFGLCQQLVEGEHGRPGTSFPAHEAASTRPAEGGASGPPGGGDQGPLPGPQTKRFPDTMPAGYPYVVGGEPRNRQFPAPRSAQRQWGAIHGRFRAGFDATAGPCGRSATCVIGTSSGAGRGREPSRSADLRLFSERQRMRSGPDSSPPAATSTTWSATGRRGVGGVAGEAGDQSPMVARCSATTRRRRSVSLLGLAVGSLGCPGSLLLGGAAAAPGLAAYLSAAVEAGRLSVFIGACGAGVAPAGTSGSGRLVR